MVDKSGKTVVDEIPSLHTVSLSDLLDSTYPLLQKFREVCPGTYKHSQAVASMVEGISIALKLDINFMKTIAVYHDVGKMYNPNYFTENQMDGDKDGAEDPGGTPPDPATGKPFRFIEHGPKELREQTHAPDAGDEEQTIGREGSAGGD